MGGKSDIFSLIIWTGSDWKLFTEYKYNYTKFKFTDSSFKATYSSHGIYVRSLFSFLNKRYF